MRFLVVSKSITPEVRAIVEAGSRLGTEVEVTDIQDPETDLSLYDVVYWRSSSLTYTYAHTAARTTLFARNRDKTRLINSGIVDEPNIILKSVQQARAYRVKSKLKTIPTFFAKTEALFARLIETQQLQFPVIAKPNRGSQGVGVIKLESVADFALVTEPKEYIFQNFIPNDGDYRVMVVGGVAVDVVKRRPTEHSTKSYLNNVSQGGVAEAVPAGLLRKQLSRYACEIAVTFSCQVVGVDFICNVETDDLYFMEINTVPQWELFRPALVAPVGETIVRLALALSKRKTDSAVALVKAYYDEHVPTLPLDKQFHYHSRMALLTDQAHSWTALATLRPTWLPNQEKFLRKIQVIKDAIRTDKKCSRPYRQTAHETHYKIALYNPVFFKLLFLKTIYHESIDDFLSAFDPEDVAQTYRAIMDDETSLFTLSTQAVNFIYHVQHFFPTLVDVPNPDFFLGVAERQSSPESWSLGSELYLLTHVIIGASQFYTRTIPEAESYLPLVHKLEQIILQTYTKTSLDQKCEFLLCAKLLKYETLLSSLALGELAESLSPLGNYFVDTYNEHSQTKTPLKFSLNGSEHRNVLALATFLA